jgi:excisionase family DNA binding protein
MTEKLLLTPEEAAERLGISRRQVYRLIGERRIRSVKIGKLRRISEVALRDFVEVAEREEVPVDG